MKINKFEKGSISEKIEVDYYVPVSIEFPDNDRKKEELFYYRFINKNSSFIEVKVNSVTKKIISVTLTLINDIADSELEISNVIEKNPIIDTDMFNQNTVITEENDFELYRDSQSIFFKLNKENISSVIKMSKHLSLFVNERDQIIGMMFSGFSKEEWLEINESIKDSVLSK